MVSREPSRRARFDGWSIAAAIVGTAAVAVLIAVVVKSVGGEASDPAGEGAAASIPSDVAVSTTLFAADDHTNLPPTPGCDQLYFHSAMAMWNPSLADEMLDFGCPFPFEAAEVSMEGGVEDPGFAARFEPRRYQELFDIVAAERLGICAVTRLEEPSVRGFVYGFDVRLKADTCKNNDPNTSLVAREYATRAHRDEAAHSLDADVVMVLGRWTITIDGTDADATQRLQSALAEIGASS